MSTTSSTVADAPVFHSIVDKLTVTFAPEHLEVVNESYKHNVPTGSETHFKVTVVSSMFDDHKLIARHRLVNNALKKELDGPVHALSISAKTPAQWAKTTTPHTTPGCKGGDGSLPPKNSKSQ
jgi:stress-induced morphogen